jgi:hypothetical protein
MMPLALLWIAGTLLLGAVMVAQWPLVSFIDPQADRFITLALHIGFVGLLLEAGLRSIGRRWLFVALGWFAFCVVEQLTSQLALTVFDIEAKRLNALTASFDPTSQDLMIGPALSARFAFGQPQLAASFVRRYDLPVVFDRPGNARPAPKHELLTNAYRMVKCSTAPRRQPAC